MKVCFANPPWWCGLRGSRMIGGLRAGSRWPFTMPLNSIPDVYRFGDYSVYPMFMGYAATYTAKHTGANVIFRDSIATRESYIKFFDYVKEENFQYVIIETATPSWDHDINIIKSVVHDCPDTKIIVTGPIAATRAEEILSTAPVHAVIKGEFEKGCVKVINEGKSGVIDFDFLTQDEMNAAPFPYMDDNHHWRYWDSNPRGQQHPQLQAWTSRGCTFRCIFCSFPANMTNADPDGNGKRIMRFYTPEYMEAFLAEWVSKFKFNSIYLDDDTMNMGDKHTLAMCRVMRKIGKPWSAMCRADTIKRETWKEMKDSGCFGTKLGFEVGSQRVVDQIIHKNLDLEEARETVKYLKSIGMTVHGTFSYGAPGETKEEMLMTRKYRESLPLDSYQESGMALIDGTPLDTLGKQTAPLKKYPGAVKDDNYKEYTDGNVKMVELNKQLMKSS